MKILFLVSAILALTGCAIQNDYAGVPDRDVKECEYEAMQATGVSGDGMQYVLAFGPSRARTALELKKRCLELRGYRSASSHTME